MSFIWSCFTWLHMLMSGKIAVPGFYGIKSGLENLAPEWKAPLASAQQGAACIFGSEMMESSLKP